ncbi:MAG: 3-phosphoserine/phosphohydroxythreonine transaminase [Deltaproteobacteria bacterium]|nr:3-phosphoserine/phosphohydroxythreonine transaminase [Deltaproteobacteria bacterium]
MTHRVINFNAGPATLPLSVLEKTRDELLDFEGTGMSLLEHSHRGAAYAAVHAEAKSLLKELLSIPDDYHVLFMQGGASAQFALVAMNLLDGGSADYAVTGTWSKKALAEAKVLGGGRVAFDASAGGGGFTRVPKQEELDLDPKARYLHITTNNTVAGTQYHYIPKSDAPLVADMSSDILSRSLDVSKFGIIYAGAQKNLGPAGVTIVIIKDSLVGEGNAALPKIFRYRTIVDGDSLQNTGPTFPIYMVRNVLQWVKANGGAAGMEQRNKAKAALLYATIDGNADFFRCPIELESRSLMNVVFRLPTEDLEKQFIAEAAKNELMGIKGHRSVGGIRCSIYNAMEPSSIEKLVGFMKDFAAKNG